MARKRHTTDSQDDYILKAARRLHDGVVDRADGYLDGTYDPKAAGKKALIKGGTTALVVLSLLTGLAFSSPSEINEDPSPTNYSQPPVVMDLDDYMSTEVDDDDDADEQKSAKTGVFARFRQAVLSLPSAVRLLIISPLWALGTALMTAVTFLWNTIFASPLGAFIASLAVGFAVLLGLFTATAKVLFPDVPLRRILCKRNILALALAALLLSLADAAAPLFWHEYPAVAALVKLAVGGSVIGILSVRTKSLFRKDKYSSLPEVSF